MKGWEIRGYKEDNKRKVRKGGNYKSENKEKNKRLGK